MTPPNHDMSVLGLIYDEVKKARADITELRTEVADQRSELAVLKDRSDRAKYLAGWGVIGSALAGAISLLLNLPDWLSSK